MSAGRFFLRAARVGWVGGLVSFALRHFSGALNVAYEDEYVLAFHHPAPSYDPHILIVPKARVKTVLQLTEAQLRAVLDVGERIAGGYESPLQMRINGGRRQEVMQAHFHLYPAAGVGEMLRAGSYGEALALARSASGFSLVWLVGVDGIWVDGTED